MRPQEIKVELRKRGVTQKQIAQELGLHISSVQQAVYGKLKSQRIESAIAQKIGKPLWVVFPSIYAKPDDYQEPETSSDRLERLEQALAQISQKLDSLCLSK